VGPITIILQGLLRHKEFIVSILLFVTVFIFFQHIKAIQKENGELKERNGQLVASLKTSNDSIKTLQGAIDMQNAAVEKLKADAEARQKAHDIEIAAAKSKADTYRQQSLDLMKLKPQAPDKCKSANDLINGEILKNAKK